MKPLRKVKLCSPQCVIDNGWHYDSDDGEPYRCPNLRPDASEPFDAGMEAAAMAHPNAMVAARRIIEDAARSLPELSANTVRAAMDHADVNPNVRGTAFAHAIRDGILAPIGRVPSDQPETHGHGLGMYRSKLYRAAS